MNLPPKVQNWLDKGTFPQRALLSGGSEGIEAALDIAAQLQGVDRSRIESGVHEDTIIFRDIGKSFKIDYSDTAKKEGQSSHENVRGLIKWISQKPVSPYRIVVLEGLERASRDAPQALLKILEEPPPKGIFICTTKNHHQILETILSRITVIHFPRVSDVVSVEDESVHEFLNATSLIDRFRVVESLDTQVKKEKDKRILHTFMTNLIEVCRANDRFRSYLELLYETQQALNGNTNPRLALERLALKLH